MGHRPKPELASDLSACEADALDDDPADGDDRWATRSGPSPQLIRSFLAFIDCLEREAAPRDRAEAVSRAD